MNLFQRVVFSMEIPSTIMTKSRQRILHPLPEEWTRGREKRPLSRRLWYSTSPPRSQWSSLMVVLDLLTKMNTSPPNGSRPNSDETSPHKLSNPLRRSVGERQR